MEINRTCHRLSTAFPLRRPPKANELRLWVHGRDAALVYRMCFLFEQVTEVQHVRLLATLGEVADAIIGARLTCEWPTLLLVDTTPTQSGASTLVRDCVRLLDGVPVLALTSDGASSVLALSHGAAGALSRDAPVDVMRKAVRAMQHRQLFLPEAETEAVLAHLRERVPPPAPYRLTPREHQVLDGLSRGLTQKDIARTHDLSLATINTHVQRLYAKLGVQSATAAVGKGLREGLI